MRKITLVFGFLSISLYGLAQAVGNTTTTKMDSIVHHAASNFMRDTSRVGLSIGIFSANKMYTYNYGEIKKGSREQPNAKTDYEIGSITKTFTAILLAHAIVESRINEHDDIRKYLDGKYPNLEYKGYPITIVDLANHTSRLPQNIMSDSLALIKTLTLNDVIKFYEDRPQWTILKDLHSVVIDTLPGSKVEYSNAGVQLLGIILERVYGMSYGELIKKYITLPMKMKNTNLLFDKSNPMDYAGGYDRNGNEMPHMVFSMAGPAGGLISNTQDLLLYIGQNADEKDKAIKLSHKLTTDSSKTAGIGLCWEITRKSQSEIELWHSGGTPGFSSFCIIYPDQEFGIVGLTNQSGIQLELSNLLREIMFGLDIK